MSELTKRHLAICLAFLATLVGACNDPTDPFFEAVDDEQVRAFVDRYVAALELGDADAMAELVSSNVDATKEIQAKIQDLGNRQITTYSVELRHDYGGTLITVTLEGTYEEGGRFKDHLALVHEGEDDLHLALGGAAPSRPVLRPLGKRSR